MDIEIKHSPSFAIANLKLAPGEQVKAESGAMVSMSHDMEIKTSTQGGVMKGLRRSVLGGESFFMNEFIAGKNGGELSLAPTLAGDILSWPLQGQTLFLQSGAYLASGAGVDVDSSYGGTKTLFSKEGLFILKCQGHGDLLVSSYGAIDSRELAPGERLTVDTGHMVAWGDQVQYKVRKVGNWKSTMLSGEGLVVDLTGPGLIYTQSRSGDALVSWLAPRMPSSN